MIKFSAIKFVPLGSQYPVILTGLRHADIKEQIFELGLRMDMSTVVEGFLNDKDEFLDRRTAKFEARKCNQLVEDSDYSELFSEDMWPE